MVVPLHSPPFPLLDVHFPTTDGRSLILSRCTELNADQKLLVKGLKLVNLWPASRTDELMPWAYAAAHA